MKCKAVILKQMGLPRPYTESIPLHIEEVELTPPGDGEILVKIHAAGLCHSDLSVIDGNRPRPLPMVLGHEAAGEVIECGRSVHNIKRGDQVVFYFLPSCGCCLPCVSGKPALCEPGAAANEKGVLLSGSLHLKDSANQKVHHHMGVSAFAEYAVVSEKSVVKIEHPIPYPISALFGCAVITGIGALINTAQLRAGQSVLITGLGGVGFAALLGAAACGASKIIAADINPFKRELALTLGAHEAIDPLEKNSIEIIKDLTRGGVEISAEFAGSIPALEFAYECTRRGGKTVTAALPHPSKKLQISATRLVGEERSLLGSYLGSCVPARDIPAYMQLYQTGRLPVDKLLTHTLRLDQVNEGFERLANGDAIRQVILL
jgi:alcohol dehydrogenase